MPREKNLQYMVVDKSWQYVHIGMHTLPVIMASEGLVRDPQA